MRRGLLLLVVVFALAVYLAGVRDAGEERAPRGRAAETASTSSPEPSTRSEEKRPASAAAAAKAKLRVRVELSDGRSVPVRVSIRGEGSKGPIRAEVSPEAVAEFDVTSLGKSKLLVVHAEHDDYLPAVAEAPRGGEAVLRLFRAAVVHGRVLDANGKPFRGANVALFAFRNGNPDDEPLVHGGTDDDGRYRLRTGSEGALVVVAMEEGRVPAAARVEAFVGRETEAAPLVLARGEAIAGRVTVNGNAPSQQAVLEAAPRIEGHLFWHGAVLWVDPSVHVGEALGFADDRGNYRIAGLVPGAYRVSLSMMGQGGAEVSASAGERDVNAPATGVDFDLASSTLLLRFAAEDDEVSSPRYRLRITGKKSTNISTTRPDPIRVHVIPDTEYRIELDAAGRSPVAVGVRAPPAGETLEVEIKPGRKLARATLLLTLRAADGAPPERAGIEFFGKDDSPVVQRDVAGEIELNDLPVGHYRLVVSPEPWWLRRSGLWQRAETEIELRAGAPNRVTLDVVRGGTARITARSAAGRLLQPRCRVLDANGKQITVAFVRDDGSRGGSEMLQEGGPSDIHPALPEGRYTLQFGLAGFQDLTRQVDIRPGERTKVELTLTPR